MKLLQLSAVITVEPDEAHWQHRSSCCERENRDIKWNALQSIKLIQKYCPHPPSVMNDTPDEECLIECLCHGLIIKPCLTLSLFYQISVCQNIQIWKLKLFHKDSFWVLSCIFMHTVMILQLPVGNSKSFKDYKIDWTTYNFIDIKVNMLSKCQSEHGPPLLGLADLFDTQLEMIMILSIKWYGCLTLPACEML